MRLRIAEAEGTPIIKEMTLYRLEFGAAFYGAALNILWRYFDGKIDYPFPF
jgi:hypothetical protein